MTELGESLYYQARDEQARLYSTDADRDDFSGKSIDVLNMFLSSIFPLFRIVFQKIMFSINPKPVDFLFYLYKPMH